KYSAVLETAIRAYGLGVEAVNRAGDNLNSQERVVIWFLTASCLKEFEEICLLCGNGYGTGAMKLLRSFYERTITLSYLSKNSKRIQEFIDYTNIHWNKLLIEADSFHELFSLPEEQRQKIEADYEAAKSKFEDEICKKCHAKVMRPSWNKGGVPELANKVDK